MKKQTLLIVFISLLTMFSCTDDLICECNEIDIKASKMEQIGPLFESISRNPDSYNSLIKVTEELYFDYTELLPLTDRAVLQRGKARGISFGLMFYSISRNPDVFDKFDLLAEKFLGKYDPSYINTEMEEITKTYATEGLNEAISRNPAVDSLYNIVTKKYLNFEIAAN